jgi:hypothetical protein
MTHNATISIDDGDFALLKEKKWSPSHIFRRAMFMLKAEKLEIEEFTAEQLLDTIYRQREVIKAQNMGMRKLEAEAREKRDLMIDEARV